jgi:hypothetical protein
MLKILFRFFRIRCERLECDFPGNSIGFSLVPALLICLNCSQRFVDAASGVVEFSEVRMSFRYIKKNGKSIFVPVDRIVVRLELIA